MICGDNVKENGMGGICSTHGRCEKYQQNLKGKDPMYDLCVDGRIILKWVLKK
jgi:hypothetical protein